MYKARKYYAELKQQGKSNIQVQLVDFTSTSRATTCKPSVECTLKVSGLTSGECVPLSSKR